MIGIAGRSKFCAIRGSVEEDLYVGVKGAEGAGGSRSLSVSDVAEYVEAVRPEESMHGSGDSSVRFGCAAGMVRGGAMAEWTVG
jgi:hypothetical protein